jgi:hypothetical protein
MYRCKDGNIKWLKSWSSTPPGKVGLLGCHSRRIALYEVAHLGALPDATRRTSLDDNTTYTRFVKSLRKLRLVHARVSSLVFAHTP